MNDKDFFNANPTRQARIRKPARIPYKDKQRKVFYADEFENEFRSLGQHDLKNRWAIVWRVPPDNPGYDPDKPPLVPIPFLTQEGDLVEDTDEFLLPLIHRLMTEAAG